MEPGHEDREYFHALEIPSFITLPQWSPVMKTGNTHPPDTGCRHRTRPQWSPVMKTGNTG